VYSEEEKELGAGVEKYKEERKRIRETDGRGYDNKE
jgi:hypothetical protein